MTSAADRAIARAVLSLADDELILGHRDSEWTGHAPILEEDIAFANLALDEIGHAQLWYRLAAELLGEDPQVMPDRWVFFREPREYRSLRLVELPRGDWAFTVLRQYLFDALEKVRLDALAGAREARLRAVSAKIAREESYHMRHSSAWVRRLGLGTMESRTRMQSALDSIWPHTSQMFLSVFDEAEPGLERKAILKEAWEGIVLQHLAGSALQVPPAAEARTAEGREVHTSHLKDLVAEMQQVARAEPEASW
ncbi:MAG: 1,2-phenylacetyl-CoA epoxidase subunit PaaC [Anaerolineales bacterium]